MLDPAVTQFIWYTAPDVEPNHPLSRLKVSRNVRYQYPGVRLVPLPRQEYQPRYARPSP